MGSLVRRGLSLSFARTPQLPGLPRASSALLSLGQQRRGLCQSGDGGPPQRQQQQQQQQQSQPFRSAREDALANEEAEVEAAVWERLNRGSPEPKLRSPVPRPPTTHLETWANRGYVSALPDENALSFRTRFYIDSTGEQPDYANKVQLVVKLSKLGLTPLEERRLIAVALPNYDRKRKELRFSTMRYDEVGRNKDFLRQRMAALLEDARENAEAHSLIPDKQLPFAARSRPWLPRDPRVTHHRPQRKLNKGSPG